MGLHLYCITDPNQHPPTDLRGIDDIAIERFAIGALTAWTSRHDRAPRPTLARLRRHHRVVGAAAAGRTPLPARFGQWFETPQALIEAIGGRSVAYRRELETLAGTVEFGVRLIAIGGHGPSEGKPPREKGPGPGTGRAYLEELARREARERAARRSGAEAAARLGAILGGLVLRQRLDPPAADAGHLARLAHLVRGADEAAYREALDRFRADESALEVRITGPWPPYSFVS